MADSQTAPNAGKAVQSLTFTASASSVFGAAEDAPGVSPAQTPPHAHPGQLPTFFLSHAFVLPGAAEQHQPHSLADTELRETASRLWSCGVSDHHRSQPGGCVAVRRSLPCCAPHCFPVHVSAALHSGEPLTNEAAGPGRRRHRPANHEQSPGN